MPLRSVCIYVVGIKDNVLFRCIYYFFFYYYYSPYC